MQDNIVLSYMAKDLIAAVTKLLEIYFYNAMFFFFKSLPAVNAYALNIQRPSHQTDMLAKILINDV